MSRSAAWLLVCCLLAFGCQRAHRYAVAPKKKPDTEDRPEKLNSSISWLDTETYDVPIVFVPSTAKEWSELPSYFNVYPHALTGQWAIHLGQSPLAAAIDCTAALQRQVVKVKVPFGLPDPTPHIPTANPPTLGAWKLGKDLFFDKILADGKYSCAECHRPDRGFASDIWGTKRNPLSLINCAYNEHQFWDGRVRHLEEVLVRKLEDERPGKTDLPPTKTHIWGAGLAKKLGANPDYVLRFENVYHIDSPTQDAAAKALATYMRTILSGNSLYDQAEAARVKKGSSELAAAHFQDLLSDPVRKSLGESDTTTTALARKIEQGHTLFFGSARCAKCHKGPLFTDGGFHNTGVAEGDEGRFAVVPIGVKEAKYFGAFRTPTLRALPRTEPYFHDGKMQTLAEVINYYHREINDSPYLAKELGGPTGPFVRPGLTLSESEARALELFLRVLDGDPVDPIVAKPPARPVVPAK